MLHAHRRQSYGTLGSSEPGKSPPPARRWFTRCAQAAGIVLIGYAMVVSRQRLASSSPEELSQRDELSMVPQTEMQRYCKEGVCVVASNAYERRLGRSIANGAFQGIILELYQDTWLKVLGAAACEVEQSDKLILSGGGCEMDAKATDVGEFWLGATNAFGQQVQFALTAKYVRREVRDLDEGDRTRFLDAMAVTHALSDEVGIRRYGERFRSSAWFAKEHLKWSAERTCDHWHSNSGFLNMHMSFTLRFEHALQAIDPRTCVHYWDFTIDEATRDCCWTDSILWSPDWFSTISPNNSAKVIDHGRWAYLRLDKVDVRTVPYHNAYGMLTAPWNTNPTPFVTRCQELYGLPNYVNIPDFGCELFREVYTEGTMVSNKDYETVMSYLGGQLHSPVHGMIGGYWNYDPEIKAGQNEMNAFLVNVSSATNGIQKSLWRKGYIECPLFCADDTPVTNCTCGLAHDRIKKAHPNITTYQLLNISGAIDQFETMSGGIYKENYEHNSTIWDIILRQIANGGHSGTADNDGSPFDPIFWIIHGMHERYMQMIRFLNETHQYNFDQTYEQTHLGSQGTYDWSNLTDPDTDFPVYNGDAICYGHAAGDLIMYPYLLVGQQQEYLSNAEYYNMTAAFSPHLPYVYDQLLNWTECGWIFGEGDKKW